MFGQFFSGVGMLEIVILGATGTCKSLLADSLGYRLERGGFRYMISDHDLVTRKADFKKKLEKIKADHDRSGIDVSIIVIDDGNEYLRVEYNGHVPHSLANVLFPKKPIN